VQLAMAGVPLLPPSGSIGDFGVGCGAGPLDLVGSGSASLGGAGLQLDLQQGQPGSIAFVVCGLGPIQQLDLTPAGFPGCTLYPQGFASAVLGVVDPAGNAPGFLFPIPNNPALTYAKLNCQGAALTATGLELSDVVLATLGG